MSKMLWIVYGGPTPARVADALAAVGVSGWTRLEHAHGSGVHGRVEGTRAWPGEETVFIAVVDSGELSRVTDGLVAERDRFTAGERMHIGILPVERFI